VRRPLSPTILSLVSSPFTSSSSKFYFISSTSFSIQFFFVSYFSMNLSPFPNHSLPFSVLYFSIFLLIYLSSLLSLSAHFFPSLNSLLSFSTSTSFPYQFPSYTLFFFFLLIILVPISISCITPCSKAPFLFSDSRDITYMN